MRLTKKISAGLQAAACRLPMIRRPLFIGWAITNRCNLNCSYCSRPLRKKTELDTRTILALIGDVAECGAVRVSFTGGEPLLRDDIGDIVARAGRAGLSVSINTNGILLAEKLPLILGVDEITVSLDDLLGSASPLRKNLDLGNVTRGIRRARRMGIPVTLHTVLTKFNLDQVDGMLEYGRSVDASVSFTPVEKQPPFEHIAEAFLPAVDEFRSTVKKLIEYKKRNIKGIRNSAAALRYLLNWPTPNNLTCCAGRIYCRIEPDGTLHSCGSLTGEASPLNASLMGFREAFRKLVPKRCYDCWCDTRIEMNFLFRLEPGVIWENILR